MNGKNVCRLGAGLLAAALIASPVKAADPMGLTTPFADPLFTAPNALEQGVALPGDASPPACPVAKDFAEPLYFAEAVDLALCNNSQIKAAWAAIKVQAATVGAARAAYFPTLSGSVSSREDVSRYNNPVRSQTTNTSPVNGSASWRLLDFGGRGANLDAASQALAAALAGHEAVLQKALTLVIQAYFDAQTGKAAWQAKQESETNARTTLETAKRRQDKGAGSGGETLQAATALAKVTLEESRARGSYLKALSVLVYQMGVPLETRVVLAEDLDEPLKRAADDLENWLREAQDRHPAIAAARAQFRAAQSRVTAARSEGLPSLNASANYYENGRLDQSSTSSPASESIVAITMNIPLFDGFAHTYKVRGVEAQVEQKGVDLADTENQILMEVVRAHADAGSALQNLEASARLLAVAREAMDAARRRYEKGAADITEILNTQVALADARQERIRSLAEWRSARLRLLASAGLLNRGAAMR